MKIDPLQQVRTTHLAYLDRLNEIRALQRRVAELKEEVANLIDGECLGVIPNTWVACGEGGFFCSASCRLHRSFRQARLEADEWRKAYEDLVASLGG